jgi:hypothetical protein
MDAKRRLPDISCNSDVHTSPDGHFAAAADGMLLALPKPSDVGHPIERIKESGQTEKRDSHQPRSVE